MTQDPFEMASGCGSGSVADENVLDPCEELPWGFVWPLKPKGMGWPGR